MLDIDHIREELYELPFRDGKRAVFVGKISEMFVGAFAAGLRRNNWSNTGTE